MTAIPIDAAFIGSCTNARLSDLRSAASLLDGRHVAEGVTAICIPGSSAVKRAAEPRQAEIDLEHSRVRAARGPWRSFPIDDRARELLLGGLDDIDDNLRHRKEIDAYRTRDQHRHPWLYRSADNRKDK